MADEQAAQVALARALEQLGALSVQKGRVDALHMSSWNNGFFSESDRLMLFDFEGAICSLEVLPGGVPALVPGPRAAAAGAEKNAEEDDDGHAGVGAKVSSAAAPAPQLQNAILAEPLPLADIAAFEVRFPARAADAAGSEGLERRQLVALQHDGVRTVLLEEAVLSLSQLQAEADDDAAAAGAAPHDDDRCVCHRCAHGSQQARARW